MHELNDDPVNIRQLATRILLKLDTPCASREKSGSGLIAEDGVKSCNMLPSYIGAACQASLTVYTGQKLGIFCWPVSTALCTAECSWPSVSCQ